MTSRGRCAPVRRRTERTKGPRRLGAGASAARLIGALESTPATSASPQRRLRQGLSIALPLALGLGLVALPSGARATCTTSNISSTIVTSSSVSTCSSITFANGYLQSDGVTNTIDASASITSGAGGGIINDTANVFTYSGVISGASGQADNWFAIEAIGGMVLSGANTFSNDLQFTGGTLRVGVDSVLSGNSIVSSAIGTGTLVINFGTPGGVLQAGGNYTIANNALLNESVLAIDANGHTFTYSGLIADYGLGATGGLQIIDSANSGGVVVLSGANTYSGGTTLTSGVLQVDVDSILSGSSIVSSAIGTGTLTFDGGALQAGGAYTIANAGTITANGGTIDANGYGFTYSGAIGGAGGLTIANSGGSGGVVTLTSSENSYTGATTIDSGATLALSGAGSISQSSGVVANGAFDISQATSGASIATLSGSGSVALGAKTLTITVGSTTFAGVIGGTGGLTVSGGRQRLSGTNAYIGATTVAGGALVVDGSIATSSLTTVDSGGTLSGVGTLGDTSVLSGGTFEPGSGVAGTSITVDGTLALAAGSIYLVDVSPTAASQAIVTGAATLGGATVEASFASGDYIWKKYTILTAASVSGTFGSLDNVDLPAGFSDALAYDSTHAYLELTMAPTATNENQHNVANALVGYFDRTGGIPTAYGTLSSGGLTQVSGEIATGAHTATFNAMNDFVGAVLNSGGVGDTGLVGARANANGVLSYADDAASKSPALAAVKPAPVFTPSWSVWGASYGGSASIGGDAAVGSNTIVDQAYGMVVGADYRAAPDTLLGFGFGGGGAHFGLANALGSGRSDLVQAGVYGVRNFGSAYVAAAAAYGFQSVTTNRTVTASSGATLQAKFDANAITARAEAGDRFATPWAGIAPYGAFQITTLFLPSYGETSSVGSDLFALNYSGQTATEARSELGARFDKTFALSDAALTLSGRLAWAHDFEADTSASATFQSLPGASFVVNGAAPAPNSALASAGAQWRWANGVSVEATFEGEFADNVHSYAGHATVRYVW